MDRKRIVVVEDSAGDAMKYAFVKDHEAVLFLQDEFGQLGRDFEMLKQRLSHYAKVIFWESPDFIGVDFKGVDFVFLDGLDAKCYCVADLAGKAGIPRERIISSSSSPDIRKRMREEGFGLGSRDALSLDEAVSGDYERRGGMW